jgi:hypothetical protein
MTNLDPPKSSVRTEVVASTPVKEGGAGQDRSCRPVAWIRAVLKTLKEGLNEGLPMSGAFSVNSAAGDEADCSSNKKAPEPCRAPGA